MVSSMALLKLYKFLQVINPVTWVIKLSRALHLGNINGFGSVLPSTLKTVGKGINNLWR